MTRIIGGVLGSLRLKGAAKATRPTSDRVKESVFSILESMAAIQGARVLDLFAGTGALGLEALSRGAASLVMVERDRDASRVCSENADKVRQGLKNIDLRPEIKLLVKSADKAVGILGEIDLLFVDPPYDLSNEFLLELLGRVRLSDNAVVVVERPSKSQEFANLPGLRRVKDTRYGDTSVSFLKKTD